jgi:hypothetical protein
MEMENFFYSVGSASGLGIDDHWLAVQKCLARYSGDGSTQVSPPSPEGTDSTQNRGHLRGAGQN